MPADRQRRVIVALHATNTEGATAAALAAATNLAPSAVKEVLGRLTRRGQALVLAARRNPATNKLEEVWGCRCGLTHQRVETPRADFKPLTTEDIERGKAGLAAARAALNQTQESQAS